MSTHEARAVAAARRGNEAAFLAAAEAAAQVADDPAKGWRMLAVRLSSAHLHDWAARAQRKVLELIRDRPDRRPDDATFLGDLLVRAGDLRGALQVLREVLQEWPDFIPALLMAASAWAAGSRFAEAEKAYRAALRRAPDNVIALDGLARCLGWLGDSPGARSAGARSLEIKDAAAARLPVVWPNNNTPPGPFDPRSPRSNVIAYSLWGDDRRYIDTALHNAGIAREIYPGWHCRFYCDETVPAGARTRLEETGATVTMMPVPAIRHAALFWRFLVADDAAVDRFLVRDADSLLTVRERVAVDDWLLGGRPFHAMRDWWSHTDLLLAGMWGGTGRLLGGIAAHIERFLGRPEVPHRAIDQRFLALVVWPSIRDRCLIHDDLFGSLGARPFPPVGRLPPGQHVGMNVQGYRQMTSRD